MHHSLSDRLQKTDFKEDSSPKLKLKQKYSKNKQSYGFSIDYGRMRMNKIKIRTMEFLSQQIRKKASSTHGEKLKQNICEKLNDDKPKKLINQQERNRRFFSLKSQQQPLILEKSLKSRQVFKQPHQLRILRKAEQKLNTIRISSIELSKQIKIYEQKMIDKLKQRHTLGNQWFQLNKYDQLKNQWRIRNSKQSKASKAGEIPDFFLRKSTTNYQNQRKKVLKRIYNLNQTKIKSQSQIKIFLCQIQQNLNQPPISQYERQNKFVREAWILNKGKVLSRNEAKSCPNSTLSQENKRNSESVNSGIRMIDSNKFSSKTLSIVRPDEKRTSRKLKMTIDFKNKQSVNHKFSKQKQNIPTKFPKKGKISTVRFVMPQQREITTGNKIRQRLVL